MLTSRIIAAAPRSPEGPEFPSLWRSKLSGTVFLMSSPTSGVRIVPPLVGPDRRDADLWVGQLYTAAVAPITEYPFERLEGPLTVEFSFTS